MSSRRHAMGLALVIAAAAPSAVAQRAVDRQAELTLRRLEDEWAQAVVHRDAKTLDRMIAPHWVYSDESGVMQREEGIKAFSSGTDTVQTAANSDEHVMLYGNSAVVIGVLEMRGRGPAGPFVHRYRYTDTWVSFRGRWKCVASQDYLMPR